MWLRFFLSKQGTKGTRCGWLSSTQTWGLVRNLSSESHSVLFIIVIVIIIDLLFRWGRAACGGRSAGAAASGPPGGHVHFSPRHQPLPRRNAQWCSLQTATPLRPGPFHCSLFSPPCGTGTLKVIVHGDALPRALGGRFKAFFAYLRNVRYSHNHAPVCLMCGDR